MEMCSFPQCNPGDDCDLFFFVWIRLSSLLFCLFDLLSWALIKVVEEGQRIGDWPKVFGLFTLVWWNGLWKVKSYAAEFCGDPMDQVFLNDSEAVGGVLLSTLIFLSFEWVQLVSADLCMGVGSRLENILRKRSIMIVY